MSLVIWSIQTSKEKNQIPAYICDNVYPHDIAVLHVFAMADDQQLSVLLWFALIWPVLDTLVLFYFFLYKKDKIFKLLCNKNTLNRCTFQPRLSGHVGTGTYPDKWFLRIWELCLNTASSEGFIHVILYVFIAIVFVTNYHSYKMDSKEWNKTEIHPLCVCFEQDLVRKWMKNRQYTVKTHVHCKIAAG